MPSEDHPVGGLGIFLGKEWAGVLHSESGSVSENAPENATLDIGISSWDLPVFRGRFSQLSSACQQDLSTRTSQANPLNHAALRPPLGKETDVSIKTLPAVPTYASSAPPAKVSPSRPSTVFLIPQFS